MFFYNIILLIHSLLSLFFEEKVGKTGALSKSFCIFADVTQKGRFFLCNYGK